MGKGSGGLMRKLTSEQVSEIIALKKQGVTHETIAAQFGVGRVTITNVGVNTYLDHPDAQGFTGRGDNSRQCILEAIQDYWAINGFAPVVTDLETLTGLDGYNIRYHLRKMKASGLITYQPGKARTVRAV